MKVALVHDWLTGMRGGEAVLEAFCELYPNADLYTLLHTPSTVSGTITDRKIVTSFIQRLPFVERRYRMYLPLFPRAIRSFDLSGYDLVLSSSHCVAKGVRVPSGVVHISYIHTPMRYIWDRYDDYFGPGRASLGVRLAASIAAPRLRAWDVASSEGVDWFIANSRYVAARIKRCYNRESTVIYPPVNCSRFGLADGTVEGKIKRAGKGSGCDPFYLVVSALVPYKRVDVAVEAFTNMGQTGRRLVVIGSGPEGAKLKSAAGPNVEFLGWKSNEEIAQYYREAAALLFPGEEDFGIVPVEAMASGTPVLAFAKGGALETVVPPGGTGKREGEAAAPTGLFFGSQTPEALTKAVEEFERCSSLFDPAAIRAHALEFDSVRFTESIREFITLKREEFARTLKEER
ncbi:MAG: glycosyltransferase [Proteobacteria bacterium]|nr:glycosyltransferase [Pseudomonadota bacterium]